MAIRDVGVESPATLPLDRDAMEVASARTRRGPVGAEVVASAKTAKLSCNNLKEVASTADNFVQCLGRRDDGHRTNPLKSSLGLEPDEANGMKNSSAESEVDEDEDKKAVESWNGLFTHQGRLLRKKTRASLTMRDAYGNAEDAALSLHSEECIGAF